MKKLAFDVKSLRLVILGLINAMTTQQITPPKAVKRMRAASQSQRRQMRFEINVGSSEIESTGHI